MIPMESVQARTPHRIIPTPGGKMSDSTIRTIRTIIQCALGVALGLPAIYQAATGHDPAQATGYAAMAIAASAIIARIMAIPAVDDLLDRIGIGTSSGTSAGATHEEQS